MKTPEEILTAIKEQATLCKEKGYPDFAPSNGICFRCQKNIYQDYERAGKTGLTHVTGCPHCNYSYCE
jgi:hypothetical protein